MARPECFVSRWKVQSKALDAGKHERTAIARPAEAQPVFGLHASFEAARRAPLMGRPMAFDRAPPIRFARARRQQNADVSACSRLGRKMAPRRRPLRKGQKWGADWTTCKRPGVLFGEAGRAGQRRLCPSKPIDKRAKKKVLRPLRAPSSLTLRSVCKAGRFLHEPRVRTPTSQELEQRQRLALTRRPLSGSQECGCRASWPCRRGCR